MKSYSPLKINFTELESIFDPNHSTAFYIVVRNRYVYQELEELNESDHCHCKWVGAPGINDAASVHTVVTAEEPPPEFGVMRLEQPRFLHEKGKMGLAKGFLFGRLTPHRRRIVDLALSRATNISRIHFGLFYSWEFNANWMIQSLGGKILVNKLFRLNKSTKPVAFQPHTVNFVQIDEFKLEFYCNPRFTPIQCVMGLISNLQLNPEDSSQTNISQASLTTVAESAQQTEIIEAIYLLQDQTWESHRGEEITYIMAMDPWTCDMYIAKPYADHDRERLEERLRAFEKVPVSVSTSRGLFHTNSLIQTGPFVLDERIIVHDEQLYLLAPYRNAEALETAHQLVKVQVARRLLWNLIRAVAILHQAGIVHNDISPRTVLLEDGNPENLLLAGFSEWSPLSNSNTGATLTDCFQIFQTVRKCLGQQLKASWTGESFLDTLWAQSTSGYEAWFHSAQDICSKLNIGYYSKAELWTTIKASKFMPIRRYYRDKTAWLHADDVKCYVVSVAVANMVTYDSWQDIDKLEKNAESALSTEKNELGYINYSFYYRFCSHLKEHHNINLNFALFPEDIPTRQTIFTVDVHFQVPYNARYGIVNLEYLLRIDPTGLEPQMVQNLVENSLEVRGFPNAQGVYVSSDHFPMIASALGLRFDKRKIQHGRDFSKDKFNHPKWYLIAPHESSELFAVAREYHEVQLSQRNLPLAEFLKEFFPAKKYLDTVVEHNPNSLLNLNTSSLVSNSCGGSVEPSEDSGNFRFIKRNEEGSRAKPPTGEIITARVREWVGSESAKRRRR